MENVVRIDLKNKIIELHHEQFSNALDMDQLTSIDYSNLCAEILVAPTLLNKVGILKAEIEYLVGKAKMHRDVVIAELSEKYRKSLVRTETYANGKDKVKHPTKDEVDNAVTLDNDWQTAQHNYLRKQKEAGYIDSLYWSIKSKEQKLTKIGENANITPEDFEKEITEKTWNGILIRAKQKLIS